MKKRTMNTAARRLARNDPQKPACWGYAGRTAQVSGAFPVRWGRGVHSFKLLAWPFNRVGYRIIIILKQFLTKFACYFIHVAHVSRWAVKESEFRVKGLQKHADVVDILFHPSAGE